MNTKCLLSNILGNAGTQIYASDCEECDISTLYILLRNHQYIESPSNKWNEEIHPEGESEGDDVERIKHYRNKICHCSSLTMKTEEFNKAWLITAKVWTLNNQTVCIGLFIMLFHYVFLHPIPWMSLQALLRLSDENIWSRICNVQNMKLVGSGERQSLKEKFYDIKERVETESIGKYW